MTIVQEIMESITTEMKNIYQQTLNGDRAFQDIISDIQELMRKSGVELAEDLMKLLDETIDQSAQRKRDWHVQRKADEKVIATTLGEIHLVRHYYRHKVDGRFTYLLDDYLNLAPHTRMDIGFKAELLERAKDMSYQKTIDSFPYSGISSKTAVMNVIHQDVEAATLRVAPEEQKKQVKILYVEADEDHVAYQDGTNRFMKLVYVHEGKKSTDVKRKRNELIHPHSFTGLYTENEELWYEVLDYLDAEYDLDYVEKIYLSGDGANWIKAGEKYIPKCRFVLDGFHLAKYVRKAASYVPHIESTLWDWIRNDYSIGIKDYFSLLLKEEYSPAQRKSLLATRTYLLSNWQAIQRQQESDYLSCSAEGHVSHILSARLSSRPLGWSLTGAENIAKMRVFCLNGGNLLDALVNEKRDTIKHRQIEKLDRRVTNAKANRHYQPAISSVPVIESGRKTNLFFVLRELGR